MIPTDDNPDNDEGQAVLLQELQTARQRIATLEGEMAKRPRPEADDSASAGVAIVGDVTERERAELAPRNSEALFRHAFENASTGVGIVDLKDGRILRANAKLGEILGYDSEELTTMTVNDIAHPDDVGISPEILSKASSGEVESTLFEKRYLHEDGHTVWGHVSSSVVKDDEGTPLYLLSHLQDITQRRRDEEEHRALEARMQQAQKLESLGLMAGGIAHDFNNVLAGIQMNADLSAEILPFDSPAQEMLEQIVKAAQRAAGLTNQMLAYAGKAMFAFGNVDLNVIVTETQELIRASISKKATLSSRLAAELPAIEADASQLQQIVMNLLINASEALEAESGSIRVTTTSATLDRAALDVFQFGHTLPPGRYVRLAVSDSGCGMDAETRAKVFDPFFSTKFTGRGLGLAAILGIVRAHGGAIEVESEPGAGSTFTILFPALDEPAAASRHSSAPRAGGRGHGTILVVDDEASVRDAAARALMQIGYTVLTAQDGLEAIELFREHEEIRGVLLDYKMPRLDGEETYRELRRLRAGTPIILSSGYSEQASVDRFVEAGMDGFLQKPYAIVELREKLRKVLGD